MKTFFILGRNPELSRAEVLEFLKARGREFKEIFFESNILVLETDNNEKFNIQEFGGVIWIGTIGFEGKLEEIENYFENEELIPADKFTYGVFGNLDVQIIKDKFKERKKKAVMKHGGKQLKFQDGGKLDLPNADFYLLFHEYGDEVYFGRVTQEYNNSDVKNRDMNKPERRESLAISPRLSKILVNLSGARMGILMLDPFCGVGSILSEALIKNIKVHGIDKDKKAIEGAIKNLEWLKSEFNFSAKYKIENIDSRKAPDLQFGAVATETPLGKVLRKKPNDNEAKQIIQTFEAYMIPILRRIKAVKKRGARIAITFPVVRKFHVDYTKFCEKTGLKLYLKPIIESREDQFISRDIVVFE